MLIEWNDIYSVGFEEIDNHHKRLLELINQSYFLILDENNHDELLILLGELVDYTNYHFTAEEELMRNNNYRNMDQHIIEHRSFVNQILSLKKDISDGNKYLSIEVFDFIKNWLLNHILEVDSEMGKSISFMQICKPIQS